MRTPTFKEQYDKIVGAYLRNELNPLDSCACFIGNLLNGNRGWSVGRQWRDSYDTPYLMGYGSNLRDQCLLRESGGFYTIEEIVGLEKTFLTTIGHNSKSVSANLSNEDLLFKAMERTLIQLRQLHEAKGEVIEDYTFTRRQLA